MAKKVLLTREHPLDEDLHDKLVAKHFLPCHLPLIQCQKHPLPNHLRQKLAEADWVLFTSAVAVDFFKEHLRDSLKIATVGPQTSAALKNNGYAIDFEASQHNAQDFVTDWLSLGLSQQSILLPQSSLSNPQMAMRLEKAGHQVFAWALYSTKANPAGQNQVRDYLDQDDVTWTFASPSAWQSFLATKEKIPAHHRIAVIGETTAKAVTESNYAVDIMPQIPSIAAMIDELIKNESEVF